MDSPEAPASVQDALAPDPALAEKVVGAQTLAQTPVQTVSRLSNFNPFRKEGGSCRLPFL